MKMKATMRKPFIMKLWETYPRTWKFLIDIGILIKYKTLNINKIPDMVTLPCSNVIYVNAAENRGRALLISNGVTQQRLKRFWEEAVSSFAPDIVIDVGVNYGECIFSTTYSSHSIIYGIEANRSLLKYINRSKDAHPNNSQISIINAIASDSDNEDTVFFVDRNWSGTSTASYIPSHKWIEKVPVKSITIDRLFPDCSSGTTVLFKVDVEGYESFVLKGMSTLFKKSEALLGFIEFNSDYMEKVGVDVDDFLQFLSVHFTIYVYKEDDSLIKIDQPSLSTFQVLFGQQYIHTDLLLVKDDSILSKLNL